MRWVTVFASVVLFWAFAGGASAQNKPAPKAASPPSSAQPKSKSPTQASQPQVVMPDADKIVLLLRNTLITLNDAVQTGNFTVLHDIGAPSFRDANSPARLSRDFTDLASRGVDLSAVAVIAPQITEAPTLDQQKGMLHLKGYFPGQPVQIEFEVLYQAVNGQWRLFGLSVQPVTPLVQPSNESKGESTPDGKK